MAKLSLNYPNTEVDTEFEVYPYGLFENGHVYEVSALVDDLVIGEALPDTTTVEPWPKEQAALVVDEEEEEAPEPDDVPTTGAPDLETETPEGGQA